ncbi:MAG: PVC-type heme-binding CxxCH protein [Pirellulales bacterium]
MRLALLVWLWVVVSCQTFFAQDLPLSPPEAIARFQLAEDLKIELVAGEPFVQDPVAIAWDSHGRLFVVEMGDYPVGPIDGKIKLLLDNNGDGVIDEAKIFADGLPYPTSVLPYQDGVLVSAAPDIWFMADTDGDFKADVKRKVVTGFGEGNQQLRVNGLTLGIDGWIYGANGRSDGDLRLCDRNGEPVGEPLHMRSHDFRFKPVTESSPGKLEITGGFSQFGLAFDDFGNRFTSWNTIPIRHVVMEQRELNRNPSAPLFQTMQEILAEGSTPRIYPISKTTPRFNSEPPGYFNASCGLTIYRGNALPQRFAGNAFMCEPLSNLVHREVLRATPTSFVSNRAEEENRKEFLATDDRWFRPVNLTTGPDGGLYVVDFYRAWVEHPQFVADVNKKQTVDFTEGKNFGRIYRILSKGSSSAGWPSLAKLSSKDLIDNLSNSNSWVRESSQRKLIDRIRLERDVSEIGSQLETVVRNSSSSLQRLHSYYLLSELSEKYQQLLGLAVLDSSAQVRVAGYRLASKNKFVGFKEFEAAKSERDGMVQFQIARSIGDAGTPDLKSLKTDILVRLIETRSDDVWFRRAIESSMNDVAGQVIPRILALRSDGNKSSSSLQTSDSRLWLVDLVTNYGQTMEADWLDAPNDKTKRSLKSNIGLPATLGMLEFLRRQNKLGALEMGEAGLQQTLELAAQIAKDEGMSVGDRVIAARLFAFSGRPFVVEELSQILTPEQPRDLQLAAVWALSKSRAAGCDDALLAATKSATPETRRAIIEAMFSRQTSLDWLVKALESGGLMPFDIDPTQQRVLIQRAAEPTKSQLQKLLQTEARADVRKVIDEYLPQVQSHTPSLSNGAKLVATHCISCHAVQEKGSRVGPDLATVAGRNVADLVDDILDPNRSVSSDFLCYIAVTTSGRVLTGLNGGESAASITLRRAGGLDETILREELAEFRTLGQSLMPTGFEKTLSPTDLADLIAFLKSGNPL